MRELAIRLKQSGYLFTAITPSSHERVNRRTENAAARDLRDVFGWSRPFGPGLLPDSMVELMDEAGVLRCGDVWRSAVRFATYDGEIFVHSAFPTDSADSVYFGPDTYRLTEAVLAQLAASDQPVRRAIDVGTGTGAVAIAIAKRAPDAEVVAVDINPQALRFARVNADLAGVANVRPCASDLLTGVPGDFDLIVANPPFMIDLGHRTYRDGGGPHGHGLTLAILDAAVERLRPGGALVMLSGTGIVGGRDPLLEAADRRLAGTRLSLRYQEIDPDVYGDELDGEAYGHADRVAVVTLTARAHGY